MSYQEQGGALLTGGYLITPIKPGAKRPALKGWQHQRLGPESLGRFPGHGVGVLCGQGAAPICALDVDTTDADLADRFTAWCEEELGVGCARIGKAPKVLLVYRAASAGWPKAASEWYEDVIGERHRLEVLGDGQQFVAYHVHPETGRPYEWVDLVGGITHTPADTLPVLTQDQVSDALQAFARLAAECGLARAERKTAEGQAPKMPREHTPAADDDFFGRVNQAALDRLEEWVPILFPMAREYHGGYRVASVDLDRDLEEDISIVPQGIVDFGVADLGTDAHDGKRTPIDLVLEWAPILFEDPLDAPTSPLDAAAWICDCLETPREAMGFGLKARRAREARYQARRDALAVVRSEIEVCDDSIQLIEDVAREAGSMTAGDMAMRAELSGLIRARFKALTGQPIPIADVRMAMESGRRLAAAAPTDERFEQTEFGNARRMVHRFGSGLMYVMGLDAWHRWTGSHWARASLVELEAMAKTVIKDLHKDLDGVDDEADRRRIVDWYKASQRAVMVKNMVDLARSDVAVPLDRVDADTWLLGVGNGAVDLRTGELRPPDPKDRITTITAVRYEPKAGCPLFLQTLSDVFFDDQEMVSFFQRLIGYLLLGAPTEDIIVIPYGEGSNGKSTVLGAIRDALGAHAKTADVSTFVSDGPGGSTAGGAREDILRLRGARMVYVTEPDGESVLREGVIKSMTGGEAMPARGLYSRNVVEVQPTWTAVMPTNHLPIIKGSDHGIWRRIMAVPFTRNFDTDPDVTKDLGRAEKLRREWPGILAWCVQGALDYQRDGLLPPSAVQRAREEYKSDMDLLREWLEECCEVGPKCHDSNANLWVSWESFARHRNELRFIGSSKVLGRQLKTRFKPYKIGSERGYIGVRVKGL